jgi:hypothetical protein
MGQTGKVELMQLVYRWTKCWNFGGLYRENDATYRENDATYHNNNPVALARTQLHRPSYRRLSADRGRYVVNATDSQGRNLGFLDRLLFTRILI